jgi:hypothetical protein
VISGLQHDIEEQRRMISGLLHDAEEQRRVISGLHNRAVLGVRLIFFFFGLLLLLFTLMFGPYRINLRSIGSVVGYSLTWVAISWL